MLVNVKDFPKIDKISNSHAGKQECKHLKNNKQKLVLV